MQRNRWETAIRCLEIAVHPNTNDEEIIAAVNGFRRTVDSTPLSQLCREFAGASPPEWRDSLDRLDRENFELRQKIEEMENRRNATLRRLEEAEQRADEIDRVLLAAEYRAEAAEQRLAEFRGAYGRISGGLQHENGDLRRALDEARQNPAAASAPVRESVSAFQNVLKAARQRLEQVQVKPPTPISSRPWTA
jgi:hypothetical protein